MRAAGAAAPEAQTILGNPVYRWRGECPFKAEGNSPGPRAVSDRFGPRAAERPEPCPPAPCGAGVSLYSAAAGAAKDATSTFTPGPMEELTAAFFR